MKHAVIIGAGTQGQMYASYFLEAKIPLFGFIDDDPELKGQLVNGIPVIGNFKDLFSSEFKKKITDVYCPIGDNQIRLNYLKTLKIEGYNTPSFIHHSVSIAPDVTLGEAIYMLPGNIIMPHTSIGNYLMINTNTTIAHHVKIGDGVFMSSGVKIGAGMEIGDLAYIGMGVTVMTGVKVVGKSCLLGAGTVIIRNVNNNAVMVGNPGKELRIKDSK